MKRFLLVPTCLLAVAGCGGDGLSNTNEIPLPTPKDFGQYELGDTQALCENLPGLAADAILAEKVEHIETTLDYITAEGQRVDPTGLTIDLAWPDSPTIVCYPPYAEPGLNPAEERVAIDGLTMKFTTADGKFAETIDAKAWRIRSNGTLGKPIVIGVSRVSALEGSFMPPPEIIPDPNLMFSSQLDAAAPNGASGAIGMTNQKPEDMNAAVLIGSIAAALWPHI